MQQEFKEFERNAWQNAVDHYDASFSHLTQQVIPSMLDVLNVEQGTCLLDVACGPGHLTALAAQRGANAIGVDFSSQMIARAKHLHPTIEFYEGDAENLEEYPDNTFDAVAMNFGILHLGQPESALREIHRVLKPNGRVAFTVWSLPKDAVGFEIILKAIEVYGDPSAEIPPAPPLFYFSDPNNCRDTFISCGFASPQTQIINQSWELNSPDALFEAFLKGTARTGGLLKLQSSERLEQIRNATCHSVDSYNRQGKVILPMPAHLAWAIKK